MHVFLSLHVLMGKISVADRRTRHVSRAAVTLVVHICCPHGKREKEKDANTIVPHDWVSLHQSAVLVNMLTDENDAITVIIIQCLSCSSSGGTKSCMQSNE